MINAELLLLSFFVGLLYAYIQTKTVNNAVGSVNLPPPPSSPPDNQFFALFTRGFTLFFIIVSITEIMGDELISKIENFQNAVPKITGVILVLYALLEGKRKAKEVLDGRNAGRSNLPSNLPSDLPSNPTIQTTNLPSNPTASPPDICVKCRGDCVCQIGGGRE